MNMRHCLLLLSSISLCASAASGPRHYSYRGSDPAGWTRSASDEAAAAGSAADFTVHLSEADKNYVIARVRTDAAGNTYVAGNRAILQLGSTNTTADVFITKLDAAGNVVFTATIGGKGYDVAKGMAIDSAGYIYLGGSTSSPNFPLRNALQTRRWQNGSSGFLVKLSPDGSQLIYSTYFGGVNGPSSINAVAADASGYAYVTGMSNASDYATTAGLPADHLTSPFGIASVSGAIFAKIAPAAERVVYSGVIAGHAVDCGAGSSCFLSARQTLGVDIALDPSGNAYIAGNTNTTDLKTTAGVLKASGIGAFVAKVNAAGSALAYLTYIGSTNYLLAPLAHPANTAAALAVDAGGNAYIAGATSDPLFPATPGTVQPKFNGPDLLPPNPQPPSDAFVLKLNPNGTGVVWATYLGGTNTDAAQSLALDESGQVWLGGQTDSTDFPNANGWTSGRDFIAELKADASALLYSQRDPENTAAQALAVENGRVHLAGSDGTTSVVTPGQPVPAHIYGIANAAGWTLGSRLSPGEIISVYGPAIGPSQPVVATPSSAGQYPTTLGGVQLLVNDTPAPLLYVSATQINAVMLFGIAGSETVRVGVGGRTPEFVLPVVTTTPEIFRNLDRGAKAVNQDGTINSAEHPAQQGTIVAIWATGVGSTPGTAADADGKIAAEAYDWHCCQVENGSYSPQMAEVVYAGVAPGLVNGAAQINFRLSAAPDPGQNTVPIRIKAGDRWSDTALIYVSE